MSTIEPTSGYVTVGGLRLHFLDWGGSGEPIVIMHATGLLGRIYAPIAEALTQIGRVYSCDQRGHGNSSPAPDGRYDWRATMEDLEAFILAMGFKTVRGFGHSAGATAVGSLACERPDLISRAVLADPVLFESPTGPELGWRHPFIERTLKRRRVFASVETMFESFKDKLPYATWDRRMLRDYCRYGTRLNADGMRELRCAPEVEAELYNTVLKFDGLGRIIRAPVPMLVLFGDRDDSLAKSLADRIAAELRNGRVAIVPGTGHFMPMEKPDVVARMAVEFLR
jgi:pimeloyl-ACP methyl ester carboxylesterase